MEHRFEVRVYYEDTDSMGVVYHANYLHFMERARTEFLGTRGMSVQEWTDRGVLFPVYSINVVFRSPARLGDHLAVISKVLPVSPYRLTFEQRIVAKSDERLLVEAHVDVVCTDLKGNLRELPDLELPPPS